MLDNANGYILTVREKRQAAKASRWPYGPEGNGYDNNDGVRSSLWGPLVWTFLGCIGRNYPVSPTDADKENYHVFLMSLMKVLPCRPCRDNANKNFTIAGYNPTVHLRDRQSFSRFICHLHNTVNKMLNKQHNHMTYEQHRELFESFKAKCNAATTKTEGGCLGPRGTEDPKPTCIIHVVSEATSKKMRKQNGDVSMVVSEACRPPAVDVEVTSDVRNDDNINNRPPSRRRSSSTSRRPRTISRGATIQTKLK